MKQQPTWRGHRAPVEGAAGSGPARTSRRSRVWSVALLALIALAAVIAGVVAAVQNSSPNGPARLPKIAVDTCLTSPELAQASPGVTTLNAVPCSEAHDGEVFALIELGPNETLGAATSRCAAAAGARNFDLRQLLSRGLEVRPLALDGTPAPGDTVACFVRRIDGAPKRGATFTTPGE